MISQKIVRNSTRLLKRSSHSTIYLWKVKWFINY